MKTETKKETYGEEDQGAQEEWLCEDKPKVDLSHGLEVEYFGCRS